MTWSRQRSEEVIHRVAEALRPLESKFGYEFVFVGGATVALYVTDPVVTDFRPTIDVDVVVELSSRTEFDRLENHLRDVGFVNQIDVICRWNFDSLVVDIMPSSGKVLGFGSRWYPFAIANAEIYEEGGSYFQIATAPCFLATKLEAFVSRGRSDFGASRDLEDIVTIVDGRSEILEEVSKSDPEIRSYLRSEFKTLLSTRRFVESLPGHLACDPASQGRLPILLERFRALATG